MALKSLQYRQTLSDIGRRLTDTDMRSIRFICKCVDGMTKRDLEVEEPLEFFEKLEERGVLSDDDTGFLRVLLDMVHRKDCIALLERYQCGLRNFEGPSIGQRMPVQVDDHDGHSSLSGPANTVTQGLGNRMAPPIMDTNMHAGTHEPIDYPDGAFVQQGASRAREHRGMIQQVRENTLGEDLSEVFDIVAEEIGRDWRQLARKLHLTESEIVRISEDHMRNLREQAMQCLLLWKKKMRCQATKAALVEALKRCRMLYIADMLEGCQFR
ncbi:LOW QUALITY PROTEIN: uncharacterized protein LOC110977598 [Acanthaster planci]|uniref:LOW QUALITY PROTEIN: uncharacterized protein LOC110977598 n=1 Tax=Acanthaster planci TaxID=133434 RepID=A0A8B7Y5E1_ACAPL|nr:LOW QUALITY PROTEIN: uncharacterized protein LOC110977598 [Acanthaster planci]